HPGCYVDTVPCLVHRVGHTIAFAFSHPFTVPPAQDPLFPTPREMDVVPRSCDTLSPVAVIRRHSPHGTEPAFPYPAGRSAAHTGQRSSHRSSGVSSFLWDMPVSRIPEPSPVRTLSGRSESSDRISRDSAPSR